MKAVSRLSLQWLLTIPYVALVLGLALAVAALSYRAAGHAVDTVSGRLLHETVQRIGQAVERHVVGSGAVLEAAFPRGLTAPNDIRGELPALRSRLWIATTLHRDPNNYAYCGNRQGQFAGLWRFSETEAEWRMKLDPAEPRTLYKFTDIGGPLREPTREQRVYDPRQRPWYVVGTQTTLQAWTAVYVDFKNHELVATRARRVDMVARYAGDEFVVLLDGVASIAAAEEVRENLERALREPLGGMHGDAVVSIGGSIGLALYPRDGDEAHSVIAAADLDMYRRKPGGRGG